MSLLNKIKAGLRTAALANRSSPGWDRDIAMIQYRESDLVKAAELGWLPYGTLEYATEVIELQIQGKRIAKTRYQWAQFKNDLSPLPSFPYRSYDSDVTKGKIIHQALLDLVALNKADPQLSIDELNLWLHRKFWYELPNSRRWDYSKYLWKPDDEEPLKEPKENAPQPPAQPPRPHHYQFAYRALPGLAIADPYSTMGLGNDTPEGSLAKFWKYVGTKVPENERLVADGLRAFELIWKPGKQVILIVELPKPLRDTEAYFVAVAYPQSWFNAPSEENKTPDLRYFVLAKSEVPGKSGESGGALRMLTKNGHGAVKFGVPVDLDGFFKEVESVMRNVPQYITWVDSNPWVFSMEDEEAKPILSGVTTDAPALAGKNAQVKKVVSVLVCGGIIDHHADLLETILQVGLDDPYHLKVLARDNAAEIINLAEDYDFDLFIIILNNVWQGFDKIVLEQNDGLEYGQSIMLLKRLKVECGKPIIAVTGGALDKIENRAKLAGADVVLQIPYGIDELRAALVTCGINIKS